MRLPFRRQAIAFLVVLLFSPLHAKREPLNEGSVGLALALRKLPVTASLLHITAHPDDEDNPLLVLLNRGRGIRTGLLTLTRGDGGQNEIGPELFEALGIIRTEELMSMHKIDGSEQFFTRAYEFGYSFSVEETLEKWGKEEIIADMVRVIREFRPDVVICMPRTGSGGGQHHQASALLTEEAFRAAADPNRFPDQIAQGLRPWKAKKLYERHRWRQQEVHREDSIPNIVRVQTGGFDPVLGRTYAEIGFEARSYHRCQGMSQLIPPPGRYHSDWMLVSSSLPELSSEDDLFSGIDTGLFAIEAVASGQKGAAPFLHGMLTEIQRHVTAAQEAYRIHNPRLSAPALTAGLQAVRSLRERVRTSSLREATREHIDFILSKKEEDFVDALRLSLQLSIQLLVDDGTVVPGQQLTVSSILANGGTKPLEISRLKFSHPHGWTVEGENGPAQLSPGESLRRTFRVTTSSQAELTRPYWFRKTPEMNRFEAPDEYLGQPWTDPPLSLAVHFSVDSVEASVSQAAEYRYVGPWVGGEQRHDLAVVPLVSVVPEPRITILPIEPDARRQLRVTVQNLGTGPISGKVKFKTPAGWQILPSDHTFGFTRQDESVTKLFDLVPPDNVKPGEFQIQLTGYFGGREFREGFQVIDYDHIQRRHYYQPADITVRTVEVKVADNLKIGFIEGVGDRVPEALTELGLSFDLLDEEDLAFGDLSQYQVIVTGIRAYLARDDLRANNARLLDWVKAGGTLIVQYNKFEFNEGGRGDSPFAPYPVKVGRGRVTDENAPVQILIPEHPVFNLPNRISEDDWADWVQERGLYFLGEKSDRYRDLVVTADPFKYNAGPKYGSLVEAHYGKGRWIYVGLGLWRQLPAGVPGAHRLLANLISLPVTAPPQ